MSDDWIRQIPGGENFAKAEPLRAGLSGDRKYVIESVDGRRLLLRVSDISEYAPKKAKYEMMERAHEAGVPMPEPLNFGICDGGKRVYQLLTWQEGENLETLLPALSEAEQYAAGLASGEILRKIHSLAAREEPDWHDRYMNVVGERILAFNDCGVRFEGAEAIVAHFEKYRHLLNGRPQTCLHGDFHVGNLIRAKDGALCVIDWEPLDFEDVGDPWTEFQSDRCAENPHFATGQIRGYFGGEPPEDFWRLLALYMSVSGLTAIPWAHYRFPEELPSRLKLCGDILEWFGNMENPIPAWYLKDFYIQYLGGIPFKLKAPYDFSFLKKYGRVFKVFDNQDSGNICFGMEDGGDRYFVKFAGAETARACVSAAESLKYLKATETIYRDLRHPNLVELLWAEEIGGGYALIFEWADAECPHKLYPASRAKFLKMPMETRLRVFEEILDFHIHAAKKGYVAVDFYDGSILYDFGNEKTVICDIDFYRKAPYINQMGRLWGSSRFMSPEEFQMGATIDEITNVYAMGATAFALFSDSNRSIEAWPLDRALYDVAAKAVRDDRALRYSSIEELREDWLRA